MCPTAAPDLHVSNDQKLLLFHEAGVRDLDKGPEDVGWGIFYWSWRPPL